MGQYFPPPTTLEVLAVVLTFVLCMLIGLERELRGKSAGVRTHVLVGLGSALFTMVSLHGAPELVGQTLEWDASRIAAQIVSGIGFLGAGVIFVQRDAVRGLTTAGAVWISAAIGMASATGMFTVAIMVVAAHFLVVLGLTPILKRAMGKVGTHLIELSYEDGRGMLREVLLATSRHDYEAQVTSTRQIKRGSWTGVDVTLHLTGGRNLSHLMAELSEIEGVESVDFPHDND